MADFVARSFIIIFVLIYLAVILGLVGWSLRGWWRTFLKTGWPARILTHLRHSNLFHRPRNVH